VTYLQVLREIEERGLRISASGSDLRLQGPRDRMDPGLVGRIKQVKPQLIAHLSAPERRFGLTLLQRGYLIGRGDTVQMGNVASHVYHEIEGVWDLERLEESLRSVVARHGMLRTRFTADGHQVEEPAVEVALGRIDLRGLTEAEQRARREAVRAERTHRMLPVDRAPMLAAEVTLLADDRMVLHVGHDGLVMDGISMFLFFRDWWNAYNQPGTVLPPAEPGAVPPSSEPAAVPQENGAGTVPSQGEPAAAAPQEAFFGDYVAALERSRSARPALRSREYWLGRIDDLPPHPGLPLAASPSSITRPRFTQHTATLDAGRWTALKRHAADAGITPTGALLAAYAETLSFWGAGDRFTLTGTLANRPPIHPRIFEAIGNFSETVLVEIDLDPALTFRERARALQARMRRDLDNRHFSGIEVLRELGRRKGTAQARMPYSFNSAIGYVHAGVDGSALELFGPEVATSSQTPQLWLNVFAFEQHGGVVVQFDSVDGLFPEGLIEAMVGGYQSLLTTLTDPAAWDRTGFDLLPGEQRARRRAANDTAVVRPGTQVYEAFLAQAALTPGAPAIITGGQTMTYGELSRRARAVAAWLRERGAGRDELVGLVMTRGPEQIVGILGTVMAGAAYLPVDAALPPARRDFMLRDGKVRCVLTNAGPQDADHVLALDAREDVPDIPCTPPGDASPDDLAYVLYTSGTTGDPKGVMVTHRSVANVVADCNARFGIGAGDRFFAVSAFTFDLSVYDVFGALSAGAALVLPEPGRAADPAHWLERCAAAGVTVWNSVPAIVGLLHDQAVTDGADPLATLRLVMMSGDRIPPALPASLRKLKHDLTVISLGGPTETTIWNILHPVGDDEDGTRSIPYGRPNANNRAYILDERGRDRPDWVTGEICAAGTGLARGYWGDQALTDARFRHEHGERLYRTGDLGRYLPGGEIEILGRADFQIKKNGYRIEAGEVETRLVATGWVRQAVVVCQTGTHGDMLVAHLVPVEGERTEEEIRGALREHLPEYMLPSVLVWHAELPLTRNRKVDRAALAALPAVQATRTASGPGSGTEREVTEIWAGILKLAETEIDPDRPFHELGGDSLAAARVLTRVRKRFGVGITLDEFYEVETVRSMAAHLEANGGAA
jgi:amino acid adenylation domain-containing protein